MTVKKLYFFDRNVMSLVKDSNLKNPQNKSDKLNMLALMRSKDKSNSVFSPLLSVMEGQLGREETQDELQENLQKELKEIELFFKYASHDLKAIFKQDYSQLTLDMKELRFSTYNDFLDSIYPKIYQPTAKRLKDSIKNEIISEAKSRHISLGHPVVICCLAILYGSGIARKVLKPKRLNSDIYNGLSDLMMINRLYYLYRQLYSTPSNNMIRIKFLTLDKNLEALVNSLTFHHSTAFLAKGNENYTMGYDQSLFPDLSKDEVVKLFELLKNS